MIITRTPFRVSFAGGGSDLKEFYREHGGGVLSVAIRKYVYLSMHPFFHDSKFFLKYSKSELVDSIGQIEHRIVREVFSHFGLNGVDFNSSADVPAGTGLGSSSTFTVGLISLCNAYTNRIMPAEDVAELACQVEIERLQEPIGKQDQYAAAVGGLNLISFNPDDTVGIERISMSRAAEAQLQNNLVMYFLGQTRSASAVLQEQKANIQQDPSKVENLKKMVQLARELKRELSHGNIDAMGEILHEGWQRKRQLAKSISNSGIDAVYDKALANGATGGKLLGAGGCGFLLFYVPYENRQRLQMALRDLEEHAVEFDDLGTTVIYNDHLRELRQRRAA